MITYLKFRRVITAFSSLVFFCWIQSDSAFASSPSCQGTGEVSSNGFLVSSELNNLSASSSMMVLPMAQSNQEGNDFLGAPWNIAACATSSMRFQQVYSVSELGNGSPFLITQIAYRPDAIFGNSFSTILSDIQINFSSTTASPDGLSTTFANNIGLDDTVVYERGPLSLSSAYTGATDGPKDFDIFINLTTPFFFDPSSGKNLLIDIRNFGAGLTTQFDAENSTDSVSTVFTPGNGLGTVNDPTGVAFPFGLVTKFTKVSVPEPSFLSSLFVFGISGGVLFVKRKLNFKKSKQ